MSWCSSEANLLSRAQNRHRHIYILDLHRRLTAPVKSYKAQFEEVKRLCKQGILKVLLKVCLKVQSSNAQPIRVFAGSAEQSLAKLWF